MLAHTGNQQKRAGIHTQTRALLRLERTMNLFGGRGGREGGKEGGREGRKEGGMGREGGRVI